jgi:adenosylcobinamide-GDP ribazoletransferase
MNFVRHYLLAVQFFTRLPVTGRLAQWVGFSPEMLRASAGHFPGVGWLAGALAAAVHGGLVALLGSSTWTWAIAAVGATVATAMLTGGFHEDGLADVTDGLGGSLDRERALDIMKDSRIGAFGAMALQLALMAKVSLLAWLGATMGMHTGLALMAAHVTSRFWPLLLIRWLPHVGDTARSKSKPLADQISGGALAWALGWTIAPLALLAWVLGAMATLSLLAASFAGLLWMGRLFAKRLQGFTGDCLGATQQITEIAAYLGLAACLHLSQAA